MQYFWYLPLLWYVPVVPLPPGDSYLYYTCLNIGSESIPGSKSVNYYVAQPIDEPDGLVYEQYHLSAVALGRHLAFLSLSASTVPSRITR